MGNALERLVAEMPALAASDRRLVDPQVSKAAQPDHGGNDRWHIRDLVFSQVAGFGARVGDELLAVAVVQLLGDREGFVGSPAPALAAGLLQ